MITTTDRITEATALAERGHTMRTAADLMKLSTTHLRAALKEYAPEVLDRITANSRSHKARRLNAAAARERLQARLAEIAPLRPHCHGRADLFTADDVATLRSAAKFCHGCPAFDECRDVAPHEVHGCWAGLIRSLTPLDPK